MNIIETSPLNSKFNFLELFEPDLPCKKMENKEIQRGYLVNSTLKDFQLISVDIKNVVFSSSTITSGFFISSSLPTNIDHTTFESVHFDGIHFEDTLLSNVTFNNCFFDSCRFGELPLNEVKFANCIFRSCDSETAEASSQNCIYLTPEPDPTIEPHRTENSEDTPPAPEDALQQLDRFSAIDAK